MRTADLAEPRWYLAESRRAKLLVYFAFTASTVVGNKITRAAVFRETTVENTN